MLSAAVKPAGEIVTQVTLPDRLPVNSVPHWLQQLLLAAVGLHCHRHLHTQVELAAVLWCCCYLAADLLKEFQCELPETV